MLSPPPKKRSKPKTLLKAVMILALPLLGGVAGHKNYQYLQRKGCFPLPHDYVKIQLPERDTVRFLVLGDIGSTDGKNLRQRRIANEALKVCNQKGCDFALLLGDNFMPNGIESIDDPLIEETFDNIYQSFDIPFIAALGNHDVKGDVLSQVIYSLKNPKWKMPNYFYQFQAGLVSFASINTSCNIWAWLQLESMVKKHPKGWSILMGHHPIYSSGVHGDNELQNIWFWNWVLKKRFDFYLAGHNHHLEHLQKEGDDTEYIISGAASSNYESSSNRQRNKTSQANTLFAHQSNGFIHMQVSLEKARVEYYDLTGKLLYHFEKKRSLF